MKSICFFIASISKTGGTERVCTEVANKLVKLGYTVTVLSLYGKEPYFKLDDNIRLINTYSKKHPFKLFLPLVMLKLRRQIARIAPNVLISVDSALFVYSFSSTVGLRIKHVVWEHFNFNSSLGSKVRISARRLAAKKSNAIVTLTNTDKAAWLNNLNCLVPVISIPNPSPFKSESIDLVNRNKEVLSVGRLTHQKGFDRLLEVWQMVKAKGLSGWKLSIVGSGELEEVIRQKIAYLGLSASVNLLPASSQIQRYYQTAGIYCMASRFEGFPMVLLEAQSFGLPLVSYDVETGPAEIIDNNYNGILINNGDAQQMAKALKYLMDDEEARIRMGQRAFENAKRFQADVIIKQWVHLLETDLFVNTKAAL